MEVSWRVSKGTGPEWVAAHRTGDLLFLKQKRLWWAKQRYKRTNSEDGTDNKSWKRSQSNKYRINNWMIWQWVTEMTGFNKPIPKKERLKKNKRGRGRGETTWISQTYDITSVFMLLLIQDIKHDRNILITLLSVALFVIYPGNLIKWPYYWNFSLTTETLFSYLEGALAFFV